VVCGLFTDLGPVLNTGTELQDTKSFFRHFMLSQLPAHGFRKETTKRTWKQLQPNTAHHFAGLTSVSTQDTRLRGTDAW
jgi:hypothetical protein